MDVGVPSSNYAPISISTIESWIAKTKREEKEAEDVLTKIKIMVGICIRDEDG